MDVLKEPTSILKQIDRFDDAWGYVEEYATVRIEKLTRQLINKDDEQIRGRIKELQLLITPPGDNHTAHVHPRVSADEEGF